MKLEFPIPFTKALRLACGGREVPERYRIFRAWWRSELARMHKLTGSAAIDNTEQMVALFTAQGVTADWLNTICRGIAAYKAEQARLQRVNAANARWRAQKLKGKAEKRLAAA